MSYEASQLLITTFYNSGITNPLIYFLAHPTARKIVHEMSQNSFTFSRGPRTTLSTLELTESGITQLVRKRSSIKDHIKTWRLINGVGRITRRGFSPGSTSPDTGPDSLEGSCCCEERADAAGCRTALQPRGRRLALRVNSPCLSVHERSPIMVTRGRTPSISLYDTRAMVARASRVRRTGAAYQVCNSPALLHVQRSAPRMRSCSPVMRRTSTVQFPYKECGLQSKLG